MTLMTMTVKPNAIVLLSGGLDSATCLAIAREQGFEPVALSFDYGQRHNAEVYAKRDLQAEAYLVKPFDLRSLLSEVQRFLGEA